MHTFKELKKASKLELSSDERRMAVLGNCSTQFFSMSIQGEARLNGFNLHVYDADYNQIEAQILDKSSELYDFAPEYVLIWLATEKLYEEFLDMDLSARENFADDILSKLLYFWDVISRNLKTKIIQPNFTEIDDKALGQFSAKVGCTFIYQIRKLNFILAEAMSKNSAVYPVDLLSVQLRLGSGTFYDAALYYTSKMTVSLKALPYVAKAVTDVLLAMNGSIKKCLVCDLDNTLWGGVIGDDGIGGIEIGELKGGHAFSNFQRYIKQLRQLGIIIAICSKNNEDIAKEPFESHEEMILRLSDISVFVANWNDKASNIKMIKETLNIGMDSIVFLDDNPFERELVRSVIPEVTVPDLPPDPAMYLSYFQSLNLFETASYSGESTDRTKQYQAEFERRKLQVSYESIDDYLISLEMKGMAKPFESVRYSRIAQLTQRSNQFNLRTVRYTENEIADIAEDERYITIYYTLSDKFGDHGLVSVVILERVSDKAVFVNTWLMSCRVLKRGMEEYVINHMVKAARDSGYEIILAEYIPTQKNAMVKDIYKTMGFDEYEEHKYRLNTSDFECLKHHIQEA